MAPVLMNFWTPISRFIRRQSEKRQFARMTMQDVFTHIYKSNKWEGKESRSGKGSSILQTWKIRNALPGLLEAYQIRSMLDLPCGDFHWMKELDLHGLDYTGADIVPQLIAENVARYGAPGRRFITLDITTDDLPKVDLLLCRDCWVHLNYSDIADAIANVRRSGITYLLATTFAHHPINRNQLRGKFRMLNLQIAPFHFPNPLEVIVEDKLESKRSRAEKNLALWRTRDLPELRLY
jgi:SAM-dependent methyltransferase